jgi:secreted PhoX family phosphatase
MSHLTDEARAPYREANGEVIVPGQSLEELVAANPARRSILKGFGLISALGLAGNLAACSDDDDAVVTPPPPPPPPPAAVSYAVEFTAVAANQDDKVTVPAGYVAEVLFSAGDAVVSGATAWSQGSFLSAADAEKVAGGNHDGMHYFEHPIKNSNENGLLVMNHELPDYNILFASKSYNAATATPEQKKIALSAVGVSVIEVTKASDGKWSVVKNSTYNKRYTGNSIFRVGGPAAGIVGTTVVGTLNNCANGATPWGTYLTCEETTDNYLDPTQPAIGYGWVSEIDPRAELAEPTKRTAMGRFDHENVAYLADSSNRVAFYMGDDGTPGCIYKFIPSRAFSPSNRAANTDLLDSGTLYVAKFKADGTGEWIELTQGKNGLVNGAIDPGNVSQGPQTPTTVNFVTQADVLINTKVAARVAGGTVMDRPEWITVAPDKTIFCTLTNNSGRRVVDAANPRVTNLHGHIVKWKENGDSPLATSFTWSIFLLAGDPSLSSGGSNLVGDIVGDTFSSPDGLRVDPQGRLWVQTDHSVPGNSGVAGKTIDGTFGHNAMFYVDQVTKRSRRFLVGPLGQEITGIAYSPDLKSFFVNIQHPTGAFPEAGKEPRSSTIVVRRTDGKPVGA